MKTIISLIAILLYSGSLFAAPRTAKQAMSIAKTFIASNVKMRHVSMAGLSVAESNDRPTRAAAENPTYYIVNAANNAGFVIVSGDDTVRDILAYSDKGNMDSDNLPCNVKYWLDFYSHEISNAVKYGTRKDESYQQTRAAKPVIAPLLGDIEWNQDAPYNLMCPMDNGKHSVTGCGATAMAMVMKYHNYPQRGTGQHNYKAGHLNTTIGADFGNTTYKWGQMLPQYGASATDEQRNAVAELMFHCGVAMDMDYSSGESGASVFAQYDALIKYFGYNPNMYFRSRDYTSTGKWEKVVEEELLAKRPVLYSGQSSRGGHAFVCDGSDGEGKYHFNWGWGGIHNGYFVLSALNPGSGGIGSGAGQYNDDQHILCGVQPEAMAERMSGFSCMGGSFTVSKTSLTRNEAITGSVTQVFNITSTFNGTVGLALYKGDEFVTFLTGAKEKRSTDIGYGFDATFSGTVPASVADGNYQLHFASQNNGDKTPTKMMGKTDQIVFYNVEIAGNSIRLTKPTSNVDVMQVAPAKIVGICEVGSPITFELQVENRSAVYEDEFGVWIKQGGLSLNKARISNFVVLPYGTTTTITITGDPGLPAGNYTAIGSYRNGANSWTEFGDTKLNLSFTIAPEGTGIQDITNDGNADRRIYTIGGQYVGTDFDALGHGIYIVNGKKVAK